MYTMHVQEPKTEIPAKYWYPDNRDRFGEAYNILYTAFKQRAQDRLSK